MLNEIKKEFFALRNGIIADTLRKAGMHYKVIFGLQIPQIAGIASKFTPSVELAMELWEDRNVRESRLLASYLFPLESVDMRMALELASDVLTQEEADMLAFRIFRRLDFAESLLNEMEKEDNGIPKYAVNSLKRHLE